MNKKGLSVIILSAGKGTRMKSSLSKLLHKIGNLEMANHVINTARKLNAEEIIVVASEENINELQSNLANDLKFVIQYDRNGTGGATKVGTQKLTNKENNILIMYGDVPLIKAETYQKMLDNLEETNSVISILGFNIEDTTKKYGRLIVKNNNELEKITEYKDATDVERQITLCNAGIVVVKGKYLEDFLSKVNNNNASKEYYLTDIIEIARKQNLKCSFIIADETEVMGVNSQEELSIAERIFQNNKRKEFMAKGTTLIDPTSVYFSYDTEIENNTIIEPNVVFLPKVKVEQGCIIKSFSYLEGCTIKSGCKVGPFARIRPDTILNNDVQIGDFVEIKKSTIHEGTKINHLSYIGDAEIGKNTNIGAGTITCNYNGFTKSKTKIGKNCFIGSNTICVAPVEIADDAMTGAGSVITKNVEQDALAISRPEQKSIKNGSSRFKAKFKK